MSRRATKGPFSGLRSQGIDVFDDPGTTARYSSDASLYRLLPRAVVCPRDDEQVAATLEWCRDNAVPVTSRGAGTSVAGNAIGPGVVLDFSRHMNQVLALDPDTQTAVVQPGVVHATLQRAAAPLGLRFGPDPSTHTRCTIGGMLGNNACGARSLGYGRTSDNAVDLRVLLADGTVLRTASGASTSHSAGEPTHRDRAALELRGRIEDMMRGHLAAARTEFDTFGRQVSGYAAQHLLPERFDLTRALVGSEGTLAVITEATVRLVKDPPHRVMVATGFDTITDAAKAVPEILALSPIACEGLDSRLTDVLTSRMGPSSVPPLPSGSAWLFTEMAGETREEVLDRARRLVALGVGCESRIVEDPAEAARLWRIREDGAGLAGQAPSGRAAWPGWEDAAVPPERLAAYLTEFDRLLDEHDLSAAPYGHFGEGCVHVRLDFPLADSPASLRAFLVDAAKLVASHGGSLSGEHGDGRARSELLPLMYSDRALDLFRDIKNVFDPSHLLNPGVLVDPAPVDAHVRIGQRRWLAEPGFAAFTHNGGLEAAVHRCTGVGKCRADNSSSGGVMCPSFLATRDEKDSTRGRARVLQEVVRGGILDVRSPEVHEALDLCLSCKGCASDCPTGVDMATYKSEVLHQTYRGRLRPVTHYTLGWLPRWAKLASRAPRLVNQLLDTPGLRTIALAAAGVDRRRRVPTFATEPFTTWWRRNAQTTAPAPHGAVILFVDTFTNYFQPDVARAAASVLQRAGYRVEVPERELCCALTWISTGQLTSAKATLRATVATLAEEVRHHRAVSVVGLEPSCTAVLRADAVELLDDDASREVASSVSTLAELLTATPTWTPPDLTEMQLVAQPHCHHHAVLGWDADAALLQASGAAFERVAGCCGLAGNFGVERGHYPVSVSVAGLNLTPALEAHPRATVVADGFSCRTQVGDLTTRKSLHLAQLLERYEQDGRDSQR